MDKYKDTPYEYYQNKLGFKIKYLTSDRNHEDSLCLITHRALNKRMQSKTCVEKQLRLGNWAGEALILFSSLDREYKDAIETKFGKPQEEVSKSWFAQHYISDKKAFDTYVAHRYGDNNSKKLDLDLVEQYTYDASMLNTVLLLKTNRKAYAKALGGVKIDIWESLSKDVNAFREVAHKLPASKDGLRRKASKYAKALKESHKAAYLTLVSGKLQNANAKKVTNKEQMALLDELINKHTNLDFELIKDVYNTVAKQVGWKTIERQTVANRATKKQIVAHAAKDGLKSLKNNVLMQNKRSRPSAPMLYWTLDGWDVELMYQKTHINDKGHQVTTYHNRLTIVVILDAHNNYPIGYAIDTHETPTLIRKALQNAMQHVKELFGDMYRPFQLQMDNYGFKNLKSTYSQITQNVTPASVGNAKAKVIEPYFNYLNKKYCKLLNNWSGHNVGSGSKSQPNDEYLNKIKKQFPDRDGCVRQLESIIDQERNKVGAEYCNNWLNTKEEHKSLMPLESYLLTFGSNTGETNKLRGSGLTLSIYGQEHTYDSFDVNFRHNAHLDWSIQFDENDLSHVLAVSTDGSERFVLEQKYIQPMALADRSDVDDDELKRIKTFNKSIENGIIEERAYNAEILDPFLAKPELNSTLAKLLISDSLGQHKNQKSKARMDVHKKAKKLNQRSEAKQEKKQHKTFLEEQQDYYTDQINVNEYLED